MKQIAETRGNKIFPNPPEKDAAGLTAQQFADILFEGEYCSECGGDIRDHWFVIGPLGLWFAKCKK